MTDSPQRRIIFLDPENLPAGFELPPLLRPRALRPAERFPILYHPAVFYHRWQRSRQWRNPAIHWATRYEGNSLPLRVIRHKSLLMRTLGNTEMWLQHNKVHNLKLASPHFHELIIEPGQSFSFCRTLGNATKRRGYKMGLRLHEGRAVPGIGGGLCQMANLLHWMILHSPLTVTQRSDHSFDAFPDNGRVLPWGVGCSISYNYVDLQFRNDTDAAFQMRIEVGEKYLEGELRVDRELAHSYTVFARNEEFLRLGDKTFRRNEIWRSVFSRATGIHLYDEKIKLNCALVRYELDEIPLTTRGADGEAAE